MKALFRFVVCVHLAFFCTVSLANFGSFVEGTWSRAFFIAAAGVLFYKAFRELMNWSGEITVTDGLAKKTLKEWKEEQEKK